MKQINTIIQTKVNYSVFISRVVLGLVLFPHGAQSMLGWYGGSGFASTMSYLTSIMDLPHLVAVLVISLQFFGSLMLIAGLLSRPVALGIACMFIGMIITVHLPHGFFMNWFGTQSGEGYEYHLLVIGLCALPVIEGSGSISLDRLLMKKVYAK